MQNLLTLLSAWIRVQESTTEACMQPRTAKKRNEVKWPWLRCPTQLLIQGQWWSILVTQRLHLRQWCERGALKPPHMMHSCNHWASSSFSCNHENSFSHQWYNLTTFILINYYLFEIILKFEYGISITGHHPLGKNPGPM